MTRDTKIGIMAWAALALAAVAIWVFSPVPVRDKPTEPTPTPALAEAARMQLKETGELSKTMNYVIVYDEQTDWYYFVVDRMNAVAIVPLAPQGDFMPDPDEQPINFRDP